MNNLPTQTSPREVEATYTWPIEELKPPSILVLGGPGSGKTFSLTTFLEAGLELFVLITDPGGEESLIDACEKKNLPLDKVHWQSLASGATSLGDMLQQATMIGNMDFKSITELKQGIAKQSHKSYLRFVEATMNFKCARTGKEYGAIDSEGWDPSRALAIDTLSGLNEMMYEQVVGLKPAPAPSEWLIMQSMQKILIKKLTSALKCFVSINAHIELEADETTGATKLMASAIGRKVAPNLPKSFSEVVFAERRGDKFFWSTTNSRVDTKVRGLPLSDSITPSYVQIVEGWQKRKAAIEASTQG